MGAVRVLADRRDNMQHQRQIKENERVSFRQPSAFRTVPRGISVLTEDLKASANKFRAEADFADWIARSATDSEKCTRDSPPISAS
jgi:hypothetical protein